MNDAATIERWKHNIARRAAAYQAGKTAGAAAAEAGSDSYDPAGAGDPRYAASYRTGWDHGWLRTLRARRPRREAP
jgi:hypothetical protein